MRYLVRDRMFAFHEEAWIETEHREKVWKVNKKLLRFRSTFHFVDTQGNAVGSIVKKFWTIHHTILIKHDGEVIGKISKKFLKLFGDRFKVKLKDGRHLKIAGNLFDREFDIRHEGTTLAHISRRWFTIRDAYAVDVMNQPDAYVLIILAVCVDHILQDMKGEKFTNL
ncbi:LURP-one-related/scramblase family protein [Kitasatospora sp. LaBMicrA B282]|uniref:LURP-one-related/scramblase family protein n=1 Tax=Kitasatospora sp. LaBMicrA B282 TaxID=3420949 RepID=UPI003D13F43F